MLSRTLGSVLRGKSTPTQITLACVLGSMLGFVPGFMNGPGLFITLALLLIVLNANLGVAALVAVAAKIVSLLIMPITFAVGRLLLDGPTQPLFKAMINAPVLALFGFEHYATTGGLIVGLALGLLAAAGVLALLRSAWRRLAKLEDGSEAYKKAMGRWWVRALAWLFIGPGGKKSFGELTRRARGNPVRPLGVVFALLVVGLIVVVQMFASGPIIAALLQRGLERANGATVDVGNADLDLGKGRLVVTGLAMADAGKLSTDLFRAARVEADISAADLLRKRLAMDSITFVDASSGEARKTPGRLVGPPPTPVEEPRAPSEKTIDDYLKDAKLWKERLAQARVWLDRLSGGRAQTPPDKGPGAKQETLRQRLEREVREKGYARVTADHLVEGSPTLLIRELTAEGVRAAQLGGDTVDVRAQNLSTNPSLVPDPAIVRIATRSDRLRADVEIPGASAGVAPIRLEFAFNGVPADTIAAQLAFTGQPPLKGGTVDVAASGLFGAGRIDLPLEITLRDTTISIPGAGEAAVKKMDLPIGVRGPIADPRIVINEKKLADALIQAGAGQLAGKLQGEAAKQVDKALDNAADTIGGQVGEQAKNALGGLLGGDKKDKDKKKP